MPPDTTFDTDEPDTTPFSADETTDDLGRPAAQVAEQRERDLQHVVARAGEVEQRAEQHEQEDELHRDADRDAVHALGREPEVRDEARHRRALVLDHLRHVRAGEHVEQEEAGRDQHAEAHRAARRLQHDRDAGEPDDDVERRRLARAAWRARCRTGTGRRRRTRRSARAPNRRSAPRVRDERLNAGNAMNARKTANARWIERASVSLKIPKPKMNGNGDAYQTWKIDHAAATSARSAPTLPAGSRPPRSASLTSSSAAWTRGSGEQRLCGHDAPLEQDGAGSFGAPRCTSPHYLIQPFSL